MQSPRARNGPPSERPGPRRSDPAPPDARSDRHVPVRARAAQVRPSSFSTPSAVSDGGIRTSKRARAARAREGSGAAGWARRPSVAGVHASGRHPAPPLPCVVGAGVYSGEDRRRAREAAVPGSRLPQGSRPSSASGRGVARHRSRRKGVRRGATLVTHSDLRREQGNAFDTAALTLRFERRATLYLHGNPATSVLRVRDGLVRITRVTPDGRTVTVRHVKPGDFFGEDALTDGERSESAEALTHEGHDARPAHGRGRRGAVGEGLGGRAQSTGLRRFGTGAPVHVTAQNHHARTERGGDESHAQPKPS